MTQPLLQAADLRGAARLDGDAVAGLTGLLDALLAPLAAQAPRPDPDSAPPAHAPTRAEPGRPALRGGTSAAAGGVDALLGRLAPALTPGDPQQAPHPDRESILAALNGVLGDHLAATDSPLAIAMQFRHAGRPLPLERHALRSRLADATPKLLVLLHDLCANDLQWHRSGQDHGQALARDLGYTPVYLHYNSGLSVSTNGRILGHLMEGLYSGWPMPVRRLVMMGHGMGGLVARSAIHHGALMQRGALRWPGRVNDLLCLGTPHQGAPLERPGHGVDRLLADAPYAAPMARLSRARSAGINDMRSGNILTASTADEGLHRFERVGLPEGTSCFAIAATLGPASAGTRARLPGDGLVPVESALGQHDDPDRALNFAPDRQGVVPATGHLDLLSSGDAYGWLLRWLG